MTTNSFTEKDILTWTCRVNKREKLHTLGAALHGPRWMRATARDLGVDYRNVARWAAGEYDVPDRVMADLVAIVEHRALTMLGAVRKARSE